VFPIRLKEGRLFGALVGEKNNYLQRSYLAIHELILSSSPLQSIFRQLYRITRVVDIRQHLQRNHRTAMLCHVIYRCEMADNFISEVSVLA
jgi:hypothetical protein